MKKSYQRPQLKVDIEALIDLSCPNCFHDTFVSAMKFKHIPAIHPANPKGQPAQVKIDSLMCTKCGGHYPSPAVLVKKGPILASVTKKDK